MRYLGGFLLLFCLASCNYFEKKKVTPEEVLNEELQTFNWNEVDQYPSFVACDSLSAKQEKRYCFETILTNAIIEGLDDSNIVVSESINDTIIMSFQISETGILEVINIADLNNVGLQIPNIDSLLIRSIQNIPTIFPAIKRGQQVKTEFQLPIVINSN
jgi:hypothetical protein